VLEEEELGSRRLHREVGLDVLTFYAPEGGISEHHVAAFGDVADIADILLEGVAPPDLGGSDAVEEHIHQAQKGRPCSHC